MAGVCGGAECVRGAAPRRWLVLAHGECARRTRTNGILTSLGDPRTWGRYSAVADAVSRFPLSRRRRSKNLHNYVRMCTISHFVARSKSNRKTCTVLRISSSITERDGPARGDLSATASHTLGHVRRYLSTRTGGDRAASPNSPPRRPADGALTWRNAKAVRAAPRFSMSLPSPMSHVRRWVAM